MMALVILFFIAIWVFDLHKIIFVKSVSRNAGDSSALAAARWQGLSLNLIGDLNIMHALALSAGDPATADAIPAMQARLCYAGPMIAFMAAQQAAKNNGVYRNAGFDQLTHEHAEVVRTVYPNQIGPNGQMLFPEPYPGCWQDYANMLDLIADEGIAAGPDNACFYGDLAGGAHYLLMRGFYDAVAGQTWCWFFDHAPHLLEDYVNFFPCWWAPLPPPPPHIQYINSEIFGLGLEKRTTPLETLADAGTLAALAADRQLPGNLTNGMDQAADWYCYEAGAWAPWTVLAQGGDDPFPLTGPLKSRYNYVGADAVTRVETAFGRLTPGSQGAVLSNTVLWTAAAKPFGYLNEDDTPNSIPLVLPAFHEVRLFPVDAASGAGGGGYDLEWRRHIEEHLPQYMEHGPQPSGCWYCQRLQTWENEAFRQAGVAWLATNSWRCTIHPGPGGGGGGGQGGGTHHGH